MRGKFGWIRLFFTELIGNQIIDSYRALHVRRPLLLAMVISLCSGHHEQIKVRVLLCACVCAYNYVKANSL